MPKSNHIHKSMLLRGIKFPPPALNAADIEATKGRAARSGRSNGGVPLQGDGRSRNAFNYGSQHRGNYHGSGGGNGGGRNSWQPPPPGVGGFGQGAPPPPPPGTFSNYGRGPPGQAPPSYGGHQPRGPPPGYEGNNHHRQGDTSYHGDGRPNGSQGGRGQQDSYRGGGNFYRGR